MTEVDLSAVDELCRLAVVARRLDCTLHLSGTDPGLRQLLDLAGVGDVLRDCPAALDGPTPGAADRDVPTPGDPTADGRTSDGTDETAPLR